VHTTILERKEGKLMCINYTRVWA